MLKSRIIITFAFRIAGARNDARSSFLARNNLSLDSYHLNMKFSAQLLLSALLLSGAAVPASTFASKAEVNELLKKGGIFRLKNRRSGNYATVNAASSAITGSAKRTGNSIYSQLWIITPMGDKHFTLRSALNLNYLTDKPQKTMNVMLPLSIFYSGGNANDNASTNYVTITWSQEADKYNDANFSNANDKTSLNESPDHSMAGWHANRKNTPDTGSDWVLEPETSITNAQIRENVGKSLGASDPKEGWFFLRNVGLNLNAAASVTTPRISGVPHDNKDFSQIWYLTNVNGKYKFQNALNQRYIISVGSSASQNYQTGSTQSTFTAKSTGEVYVPSYNIMDQGSVGFNINGGSKTMLSWYEGDPASEWYFIPAKVDEAALAAARSEGLETKALNQYRANYTNVLKQFFNDLAFVELKEEYKSLTDEKLREELNKATATELANKADAPKEFPAGLANMVLKVKNDSWSYREKEFRFYNYKPYSDPVVWAGDNYVGTGYQFSPQTGPTGVSVKRGEQLIVFVGTAQLKSGTSLRAMVCNEMEVVGTYYDLKPGFNLIISDAEGHLFIDYRITNANIKLASIPALPIHIEGGRVNGYFDITRGHTNKDFEEMSRKLFKDPILHMKNQYYQFNMHLDGVKQQHSESIRGLKGGSSFVYADGVAAGIQGVLQRWDSLVKVEHDLMGIDQYLDRFNCMLSASASSKGNPYATNYGTYYPGTGDYLNQAKFTKGWENDEGAPIWVVAHETGHIHQKAINMAGDTEMSVNFFSQVYSWFRGSNVGRGRPLSNPIESFHKNQFRDEFNIWTRSRLYFQLWLHYQLQGHHPNFFPEVFARLRKTPMRYSTDARNPLSGLENYLRFAMVCSDVAQEDLSEFFQFYGFFKPVKNHNTGDYHDNWFTTTQADIDKAIAHMKKYPKAHPGIIFIDERIERLPAIYPGAPKGALRVATSDDATPGDAKEVGDVGFVLHFTKDNEAKVYETKISGNRITVDRKSGKGAVGFKIYDLNGKLVRVSNTYTFTIPSEIVKAGYFMTIAHGNGKESIALDPNDVAKNFVQGERLLTGVATVAADKAEKTGEVYDLSGRKAEKTQHGVLIQNGKIVVK